MLLYEYFLFQKDFKEGNLIFIRNTPVSVSHTGNSYKILQKGT